MHFLNVSCSLSQQFHEGRAGWLAFRICPAPSIVPGMSKVLELVHARWMSTLPALRAYYPALPGLHLAARAPDLGLGKRTIRSSHPQETVSVRHQPETTESMCQVETATPPAGSPLATRSLDKQARTLYCGLCPSPPSLTLPLPTWHAASLSYLPQARPSYLTSDFRGNFRGC